tara:strand:- start:518 stop:730 length:213 start_codon:yes stop_codon:yes gene_type:complete
MVALMKKSVVKEDSLLNSVSNNLTENSKAVKTVVQGSKKLVGPLSKLLDYALVSVLAVVLYKTLSSYMME